MRALIIVDVQNDFLPGGALEVPGGDKVIPVLNSMQAQFDLVVATQDWHPEGHSSFASQHEGMKPFDEIEWKGSSQILWPDHCVQGTAGAEISNKLNTKRVEAVFRKGTDKQIDSYSGFYDNNHERSTALADYLRGKRVDHVFIGGLATDVCVYYTALDSLKEGFKTTLIRDASRGLDESAIAKALQHIQREGGQII
ncbi:MAG: bifunctional nicotinamidase/pyrazinamidase [Bacteroidales bacterium]